MKLTGATAFEKDLTFLAGDPLRTIGQLLNCHYEEDKCHI